jgi:uncharacterized protein YuzE
MPVMMLSQVGKPRSRRQAMKIRYHRETDRLHITLSSRPSSQTREIENGITLALDKDGNVVGLEFDHASSFDLSTLDINLNNQRVAMSTKIS